MNKEQKLQADQIVERIFQGRKYPKPRNILGRECTGDTFYSDISNRVLDITRSRTSRGIEVRDQTFCYICDRLKEKGFKLFS